MTSPILAIVGATLLADASSQPVEDSAILVEGNRIVAAGPRAAVSVPPEARVIQADGQTVLPGLIDVHTHTLHPWDKAQFPRFGVTCVRYAGSNQAATRALRDAILRGDQPGPRIFSCGPTVDQEPVERGGGHSVALRDAAHARVETARLIEQEGVDALLVVQRVQPDVLTALLEEAHARNVPVTGQNWATSSREAARLGIDGQENTARLPESPEFPPAVLFRYDSVGDRLAMLSRLWARAAPDLLEQTLQTMAEQQVAWAPEIVSFEQWARLSDAAIEAEPTFQEAPAEFVQEWRDFRANLVPNWTAQDVANTAAAIARLKEAAARYVQLGGPLVTGTDLRFGALYLHRELQHLADAGLSSVQILTAATTAAARALRREHELGRLAPGYLADLIVVPGDPLADLSVLRRPTAVLVDGRLAVGNDPG